MRFVRGFRDFGGGMFYYYNVLNGDCGIISYNKKQKLK